MYCVIQEIQLKKPNTNGEYREYEVTDMVYTVDGRTVHHYGYHPKESAGKFERPHREAYRVTLHKSYRLKGKVQKKQYSIATIGYYQLAEDFWSIYELVESGVVHAAEAMGQDFDTVYDIVENKLKALQTRIRREYHKTEEYKAKRERDALRKNYSLDRKAFAERYGVKPDEYDHIYDYFGNLRDGEYLKYIIHQKQQQDAADRMYENAQRRYYKTYQRTYTNIAPASSTYTDEEHSMLKEFYRVLSRKFHPDVNPDKDTTAQMQLINKLKTAWDI